MARPPKIGAEAALAQLSGWRAASAPILGGRAMQIS